MLNLVEKKFLFVGWEVCIAKTCDSDFENAGWGTGQEKFFQVWGQSFLLHQLNCLKAEK